MLPPWKGASMRVRLTCLLSTLLLVPSLVYADGHKAGLYGGGSGGNGASKLFGFHEGLEWPLHKYWRVSIVAPDISVEFGSHEGVKVTQFGWMFGARVALHRRYAPNKYFVHATGGGVYTNDGTSDAGTNGVIALGGGYERFFKKVTKEQVAAGTHEGLGIRVQYDYIFRDGDTPRRDGFSRVSAGV